MTSSPSLAGRGDPGSFDSCRWLASVLSVLVVACSPSAMRTGPALPTSLGEARNGCERERWYEVAPAQVRAEGATAGVPFTTLYFQDRRGLGLFRAGGSTPQDLEDAWPKLHEPELERRHVARIEPVDADARTSLYWALGGLAGLGAGLGTAAAVQDSNKGAAAVFGVSGIALGLVGVIGALATQPSGARQLEADTRRRLFLQGEDDLEAVKRGVDRNNAQVRAACRSR